MPRAATGIREFLSRFPDNDACFEHLAAMRLGARMECPACLEPGRWTRSPGRHTMRHACGSYLNVLKGSAFYRSNIPLGIWFYAILLFCNSTSGIRLSYLRRQTGLGLKSSLRLSHAIRSIMAQARRPWALGGPGKTVCVDEVQVRRIVDNASNRHTSAILLGMSCEGQVLTGIIANRSKRLILQALTNRIAPGSRVITDGHASYRTLGGLGFEHLVVDHSRAFHDFKGHTTNEIEAYWSVLRRTFDGYRQVWPENLWRYVAEVEFRYNRRASTLSPFEELIADPQCMLTFTPEDREPLFDWRMKG